MLATSIEQTSGIIVQANSATDWLILSIDKSGYTPIGIVGVAPSVNNGILMNQFYLAGKTIQYALYNTGNETRTITPRFYVLWKRNSM